MYLSQVVKTGLPFRSVSLHRAWIKRANDNTYYYEYQGKKHKWSPSKQELVVDDYIMYLGNLDGEQFEKIFPDGLICWVWNNHENFKRVARVVTRNGDFFVTDSGQIFTHAVNLTVFQLERFSKIGDEK